MKIRDEYEPKPEPKRGRKPAWTRQEKRHDRTQVRAIRDNPVAVVLREGSIAGTSL